MKEIDITETEDIKVLLIEIEKLFENYSEIKKEIETEIYTEELKQDDYLHELELAKLNGIEIMHITKELIKVRRTRRTLKNKLELLNTVKTFVDKYTIKGILSDVKQTISNIDKLIDIQSYRNYTPRIIKDLKCAKSRKKEEKISEINI